MAGYDRQRFTIGQIMVTIACIALAIALLVNSGSARTISIFVGFVGVLFLVAVSVVATIDVGMGIRCPNCGGWSMGRTSVTSFRDRFFRCSKCGVRCRRGMLSGWEDASGSEFDRFYTRKRPENPWTAPPGLEDEDLIYSKTHVNLLLNKKRRNPDAPDQETGRKP
jgi:predicted RNA-binding Zn-ribbon protein involved in translation (DUF1610 family)